MRLSKCRFLTASPMSGGGGGEILRHVVSNTRQEEPSNSHQQTDGSLIKGSTTKNRPPGVVRKASGCTSTQIKAPSGREWPLPASGAKGQACRCGVGAAGRVGDVMAVRSARAARWCSEKRDRLTFFPFFFFFNRRAPEGWREQERCSGGGRDVPRLLILLFHWWNQWEYLMLFLDDCLIFALSHV